MSEEYDQIAHLLKLVLTLLVALDNEVLSRKLLDLLTVKVVY